MRITYSGITLDLPADMIPQDGQAMVRFLDEAARAVREVMPWHSSEPAIGRSCPIDFLVLQGCLNSMKERRTIYPDTIPRSATMAAVNEVMGVRPKPTHALQHPMADLARGKAWLPFNQAQLPTITHWDYLYGFGRWPQ